MRWTLEKGAFARHRPWGGIRARNEHFRKPGISDMDAPFDKREMVTGYQPLLFTALFISSMLEAKKTTHTLKLTHKE